MTDLRAVEAACADGVDAIYCETIANPGSTVADLDALGVLALTAGRAADRRLDARHAAAVPAARARRARGAALRDEVPERPPRRARRGDLRQRRRPPPGAGAADRHGRRGRAGHRVAAAARHAHAGAADRAAVRQRAGDRRLAGEPRRRRLGALPGPAVPSAARARVPAARRRFRRRAGVRGRGRPRRRRGGHERHPPDRALDVARRHRHGHLAPRLDQPPPADGAGARGGRRPGRPVAPGGRLRGRRRPDRRPRRTRSNPSDG